MLAFQAFSREAEKGTVDKNVSLYRQECRSGCLNYYTWFSSAATERVLKRYR